MEYRSIIVVALFCLAHSAFAGSSCDKLDNGVDIVQCLAKLNHSMAKPLTMESCNALPSSEKSCLKRYLAFIDKPEIKMTIAEGYLDGEYPSDSVWSASDLDTVIRGLLSPCVGNNLACGFKQDPNNMEFFTKTVVSIGGAKKLIRIHAFSAALSADPKFNARHAQEQAALSARVNKEFLDAIATGQQAIFYNGHARNGGGPDFSPAHYKNGKIDFAWYLSERAHGRGGEISLEKTLHQALVSGHSPSFFGDFSCDSQEHFEKTLHRANPSTALILSTWLTDGNATTKGILTSIDMMLKLKCAVEFNAALIKNTRATVSDGSRRKESEFDLHDFH